MKALEEYKDLFKDCNVSQTKEGYESLGIWVNTVRQAKKGNGTMKLTDDMIDRLNDIGFEWNFWKSFDERMKELEEYKDLFKNCNVSHTKEGYESLGCWVRTTRQAKKGNGTTKLTDDMIDRLIDIGFEWKHDKSFDEHMKELEEYKDLFNDCNVPRTKEGYESLGVWVKHMRKARKQGTGGMKLTGDMIVSLNDIGFFWGRGQSAEFSDAEKEKFGMITP